MIFDIKKKGPIHQGFLDNATPLYKSAGLAGHTGIDWGHGYGSPVTCDNDCYVYKVIHEGDTLSNWQAVYTLVEDKMEVCFGHLSRVDVKEGQHLKAGQQVGLEGNKGDIYDGATRITVAMQKAGDHRGAHVHESWRPVTQVWIIRDVRGVHYLRNANDTAFQNGSSMYEITYDSSQTKGCIDPLLYTVQTKQGLITSLKKQVLVLAYALLGKLKR